MRRLLVFMILTAFSLPAIAPIAALAGVDSVTAISSTAKRVCRHGKYCPMKHRRHNTASMETDPHASHHAGHDAPVSTAGDDCIHHLECATRTGGEAVTVLGDMPFIVNPQGFSFHEITSPFVYDHTVNRLSTPRPPSDKPPPA